MLFSDNSRSSHFCRGYGHFQQTDIYTVRSHYIFDNDWLPLHSEAEDYVKSYYEALPGAVLNASQMKTLALKILP